MVHQPVTRGATGTRQMVSAAVLRTCAGIYMVFYGFDKTGWLIDASPLATQLSAWLVDATSVSRWYLERIIPGAPVFARIIPIGSLLGGAGLVFGAWTRMAAALSLAIVLSLQLAEGAMFRLSYLRDAAGLLLTGALIALLIAGDAGEKRKTTRNSQ